MDALDEVLRVVASLNREGVDYVVVGGVALNMHGLIRATEDLDLFVRPDPANIARLRAALATLWADPAIEEISADDLCGEYPVVRYGPPEGSISLDILTRMGSATSYEMVEAETKVIEEVPVALATPRALFRMKRNTVRPIDRADAMALQAAFNLDPADPACQ